jgi:hypothetical protein
MWPMKRNTIKFWTYGYTMSDGQNWVSKSHYVNMALALDGAMKGSSERSGHVITVKVHPIDKSEHVCPAEVK